MKADKLNPSTPSQHAADFYKLQEEASDPSHELHLVFYQDNGHVKPVVQFEVDGGTDENPAGRETQFLLTEMLMGGPLKDPAQRRAQVQEFMRKCPMLTDGHACFLEHMKVGSMTREAHSGPAKNKVERLNGAMTMAAAGFHALSGATATPLVINKRTPCTRN